MTDSLRIILKQHFEHLSEGQLKQFEALEPLYREWNARINVISRKDMDSFMNHHLLHSLAIAKVQGFKKGSDVLDIGTGGGFPGIPLAIMFPEVNFTLADSIGKKITVVKEVSNALGIKNVRAIHSRAEQINDQFDFIVSRAVAAFKDFMPWTKGKYKIHSLHERANGLLYLKGGDLKGEMAEAKVKGEEFLISQWFSDPFFETKKVVYVSASR